MACAEVLTDLAQQLSQRPDAVEEWGQLVQHVMTHYAETKTGRMFAQRFTPQSQDSAAG